jgi:hypothetical protein
MIIACPYCGVDTVMVLNRKSGNWRACDQGTTRRHRCSRWPHRVAAQAEVSSASFNRPQSELRQGLERAADDGWPARGRAL